MLVLLNLLCRFAFFVPFPLILVSPPSLLPLSSAPTSFALPLPSACLSFCLSLSLSLSDLKDFQNNKHRYLLASENQRPGHFSTASMGSLTASPSSCSLSSQVGFTAASSIQERIMSTPGGEEAIERLKVRRLECQTPKETYLGLAQNHICLTPVKSATGTRTFKNRVSRLGGRALKLKDFGQKYA